MRPIPSCTRFEVRTGAAEVLGRFVAALGMGALLGISIALYLARWS